MKKYTLAIMLTCLCAIFYQSNAQNLYVDSTASGSNNGSSWANAFTSLSVALDSVWQNPAIDSVLVAKGTYYPTKRMYEMQANKKGIESSTGFSDANTFHVRTGLVIHGGYPNGVELEIIKTTLAY